MPAKKAVAVKLRCEYLVDPVAIDAEKPRLSWEMESDAPGAAQTAWRVLASDSKDGLKQNKGNLWDSGKVESSQSLHIHYDGKKLKSCQQVFWKVMIWDESGREGRWSKVSHFGMGLLDKKDWQGEWIGHTLADNTATPLFRKEFSTKRKVKRAVIYTIACGSFHLTIDGKDVHTDRLTSSWTEFEKRHYYRAYDVTKLVSKRGRHCLGTELGDAWYRMWFPPWGKNKNRYGDTLSFQSQLRLEYENGTVETVATDTSWKTTFGPTLDNGIYEGETYDAQLEEKGWDAPGFDDSRWETPVVRQYRHADAIWQVYPAEPVQITEELKPVDCWTVAPNKVIYDFGQNFAGHVRLHVKGKAGTVVRMRFGEMVNFDQTLYVDNLRGALASDTYIMRGLKNEVWEPKFTFHGFRYVEVSGLPVRPSLNNLTGVVVGSDTPRVGHFECSDKMVNKVFENAVWTQRANFLEVPTDCPQRNERLGWTGDAQVFIRTAICNMDTAAFFKKWMRDLKDSQSDDGRIPSVAPNVLGPNGVGGAAWSDAVAVCPWALYQCYEDKELLADMYPAMKDWVAYLKKTSNKLLCDSIHTFGDWLSINANTPRDVVRTAHFAYATDLTRKAAEALGQKADAKKYQKLFNDIKKVFNKHFVKSNGKIEGDTQTGYLMALKFNLLSPKRQKQAAKHLVANIKSRKNHLSTGFIGTALIMSVLRDTDNLDTAYTLLENKTFPSWGYSVVNGATSIWERWNGWTKEDGPGPVTMNSYSHYAYGAVVEWMFDTIAGIDHSGTGFQKFALRPLPGGNLKHASASYHSPYGVIKSAWKKSGKSTRFEFTIPANTQADVQLPVKDLSKVKLDGKKLENTDIHVRKDGSFTLPAGAYAFQVSS